MEAVRVAPRAEQDPDCFDFRGRRLATVADAVNRGPTPQETAVTDSQFRSLRSTLLLIALGLFANAAVQLVPPAVAGDRVDARIDGGIEVDELRITDFRDALVIERIKDEVEVKMDGPGASRAYPLYIKVVE